MMKEDKLREKAMQFQMLQANIQSLQERENMLVQKIEELHRTRLSLKELDITKKGDAFIPIGSGNFIPGKITELDKVLIGIGGGVAVKKERTDAIGFVQERIDEKGNKWRKVYLGGGAHFRNWLVQCKELGEVEVEEVDSTGFKCYEEDGEKAYRIWVKVVEDDKRDRDS